MTALHIHFHGNVEIHFPTNGDIPSPLFDSLKELLTMNFDEVKTALDDANTKLEASTADKAAILEHFDKGINEVIVAISQSGGVPQAVVDAVTRLQGNVTAIAAGDAALQGKAKALDDLTPDAPPAP